VEVHLMIEKHTGAVDEPPLPTSASELPTRSGCARRCSPVHR